MSRVLMNSGIILLSENDVLRHVPTDVYEKIKQEDAHPMFVMMTVGHEGDSKGKLFEGTVEKGKRLKNWYKQLWPLKAVKQLLDLMRSNIKTPVYEIHTNPESDENTRVAVGSIIACAKKMIGKVTHAQGVAYINNYGTRQRIEDGYFDACSLEADCTFEKADNLLRYVVHNVSRLFGVALCNSDQNEPGFEDAHITAVVTAMAEDDDDDHGKGKGERMNLNLKEVKEYIEEHKLAPEALFSVEVMTKSPKVKDALDAEIKAKVEEKDKTIEKLVKELEPFKDESSRRKVAKMIVNSSLLENEEKKVVDYLGKVVSVDVDGKDDAQKLVDAAIKTQLELMKGAGFEIKGSDDGDKDKGKGKDDAGDKNKGKGEVNREDMTLPDNNPLIPQPEPIGADA